MSHSARWLAIVGLVLVLGAANYTIWQRQQVVDHGLPVLLELRPVDPRSLIQGDYMELRYVERVYPRASVREALPRRGTLIVKVDENGVATFARLDDQAELAADERRLRYKQVSTSGEVRLGAESFFFEEGQAEKFEDARFGVLHVDAAGNSVLVGLADEQYQLME